MNIQSVDNLKIDPGLPKPERLMIAAEYEVAMRGIAGASLQNAAKLAGASSTSYQYYFGQKGFVSNPLSPKENVIQQILEYRSKSVSAERLSLIERLEASKGISHSILDKRQGKIVIPPGYVPPYSYQELFLIALVPLAKVIWRQSSSHFAQFLLMVYLADPAYLESLTRDDIALSMNYATDQIDALLQSDGVDQRRIAGLRSLFVYTVISQTAFLETTVVPYCSGVGDVIEFLEALVENLASGYMSTPDNPDIRQIISDSLADG